VSLIKNTLLFIVVWGTSFCSFAQTEAEIQTKADELFRNKQYVEATSLYLRLLSLQPKSFDYSYKYGTCLLFNSNSKQDAIRYLNYAIKSPAPISGASFFLGKAFHLNYQFNDAISQYKDYLKKNGDKSEFSGEAQRNIVMCENGKSLLTTLTDVVVRKKTEITQSDFFRLYDLTTIGGSIIVAIDFQSKNDKKYKHNPVVHISPNMENVYFSSYGEGENLDIYVARKLPGGKFGVPQKVEGINTPFDENFPYMHPNGKELYFSSKGHNSMGGYDVFKALFDADKNTFTDVSNVDFSISSPDDDLLYIVDKDYKNAYFSSTRQSQDGKVVVYQVAVERIPIQLAIVKGAFSSSVLPNNPRMTVEVVDKASGKRIGQFNTLKENSYLITFPKGGKYEYRISIAGSNETFKVDVDVPFLKELRPLKQTMIHEVIEAKEQIRIINQFDEQFEDAQSIVAQVLKERANLNVNSDQYSQEELEGSQKVKTIVAELKLENKSLTEIGQLLSRKAEEINQQQANQQQLQTTSNGLVSSLYQEINAIDAEIKNLVKEADLSESVRRKELVLTNAKDLYEQRDSKQQQIQQIQTETKTLAASSSGQPVASSAQLTEISKQFDALLAEGNEAKIATLMEQNKSYLKETLNNQNTLSESEKLLQQQNAIDAEIKRLQEIESTHVQEINRLENEIKDLTEQKAVAKEKLQQEFQDKIDAKNNQLEDNRVSLERTRVRIEHEHAKRTEVNRRMSIVHEIENFKGKQASNEELEKVKASVREDNSRTLKAYIENTLSSISGQQQTAHQELKTIEQYNTESEAIYANQDWSDYEKSQRLVDLNASKQKEITAAIQELNTSTSVNDPEKSKQLANAQKLLEQLKEDQEQLNKQLTTATQKEISQLSTENIIQQLDPEYNSSIQSINNSTQLSAAEKLEQLNNRNEVLIEKLQSEVSQLINTTSTPLVAAKKELLNQHIQHLKTDNQKRTTEIQRLNQQKAEELAQQQTQQTTPTTKSVEEHTAELQQQYTGNLQVDFSENPTTENAVQGTIQRLGNYETNLKQQLTATSKITNEAEKQQRTKAIEQELNRVKNRIGELKQQQIALQQKAEELAQQQTQQTTPTTKSVEEHTAELQQQYTGNLQADFSENPTTENAVQGTIQRLGNYENNLKQQLTTASKITNEAEKQQRTKAIEQELNRVGDRLEELKQKAQEIAQQQLTENQTTPTNIAEPSREERIQKQLIQDDISKTARKELTQELNQIKQENATKNSAQLNEINTALTKQIEALENRLSVNSSETKAIQANHDQIKTQLQKDIEQEKNVLQKERLTQQLVRENEVYTKQLERIQQLYENDSIVSKESQARVYSQNELQTRRKRALIEIEELSHLYDEIEQSIAVASKKEQPVLLKELDAIKAKKAVVESELTFIERQLELYAPVEKPLPLAQNNVAITYNEERAIAVTEQYEKYAQAIIKQNQLINQHQTTEKLLLEQQQTLEQLRNQEKTSDLNTLSKIQQQKQEVIAQIEKSSLYLEELETEISNADKIAITHLPTDAVEVMKFQNLVARGINPIKKTVIATALIPISASGIEYNPAVVKIPELKSIPVNLTAPKGLVYRVQVGAFAKPIPEDHFKEFTPVSGEKLENSNITRYMAGYFNNANAVVDAREKIRQFGYNDAFVVAYCDGKRIQFAEARRMEAAGECKPSNSSELQLEVATNIAQKLGLEDTTKTLKKVPEYSYNQAEGAAKSTAIEQLPGDQIYFTVQVGVYNKPVSKEKLHNLTPLYTLRLENGQIRYSVGIFGDLTPARALETLVRKEGISDAFIVAYYQGNRITVERARKLISEGVRVYSEQNSIQPIVEQSKVPVPTTTEVNLFTEGSSIKPKARSEQFVQFISKETYDTYPREELNRFNTKGVFHYDKIDKHIKSIYYPKETVLPRISAFSNQMDTLVFSNLEATNLNTSTISIELNLDAIPGDFNDWLIKYPYRKAYSFSENGLEIHIFDVRLEDVQEMKIMTELFGFPIRESLKEESK
jgi:hypothetical protein